VGPHELGWDYPDGMSHSLQLLGQPLRAGTGLHPYQRWLGALEEGEQGVPAKVGPLDDSTSRIGADDRESVFTQADSVQSCTSRLIPNHCSPPLLNASE